MAQLLQRICEANTKEVPVWISKWDIYDDFYQCNLRPSDVVNFTYMVPLVPSDTSRLLCVDLVLPVGWVNSPDFFYSASKTAVDNANAYTLESTSPLYIYPSIDEVYHTSTAPPASPYRLQYI